MVAELHHASQLEADRYRVAADKAHGQGLRSEVANRLAGLIAALDRLDAQDAAADAADERYRCSMRPTCRRGARSWGAARSSAGGRRDPDAAIVQRPGP